MRFAFSLAAIFAATAAAGCATMPPPPPATLAFGGANCAATPDLTQALSLTPDKERSLWTVTTQVGSATPCVRRDGRESSYLVYAIPEDAGDKTLTVGGYLEPLRIFSPRVEVLDGHGETSRSFRPDEFMYRGPNYSVLFRPRPGERYVLVTTEDARVGQKYDSIVIGVTTTSTGAVAGSALAAGLVGGGTVSSGTDVGLSRTFSYEGAAQVIVHDNDTKEEAAAPAS
ncbi:hypothetical protein [Brevundimonas goettingensis]|uniref:Lipoprotein n=1 Tax=Brevundimonas goettingensis TaxID=2774190 RepID=A0A975C0K7_9CAUL|nr:hypothetical protein [Brevundimonas goettingensis]QTC91638.1 hypothetical protein IFJ75_01490 [Brevundimonas goettingensis]